MTKTQKLMLDLTVEELNCIVALCGETKAQTLDNFFEHMPEIEDSDIRAIAESAAIKLDELSEEEFAECDFSGLSDL